MVRIVDLLSHVYTVRGDSFIQCHEHYSKHYVACHVLNAATKHNVVVASKTMEDGLVPNKQDHE